MYNSQGELVLNMYQLKVKLCSYDIVIVKFIQSDMPTVNTWEYLIIMRKIRL